MRAVKTDELIKALDHGKIIANPESWKNNTAAVTAVSSLLTLIVGILEIFGISIPMDDGVKVGMATALWSCVGALNVFATFATSAKVGITSSMKKLRMKKINPKEGQKDVTEI